MLPTIYFHSENPNGNQHLNESYMASKKYWLKEEKGYQQI